MKPIIVSSLLMVSLLASGCAPASNFDARLSSIVEPYRFSIAGWEWQTLVRQTGQWLLTRQGELEKSDDEIRTVTDYFTIVKQIKTLKSKIAADGASSQGRALSQLEDELRSLQQKQTSRAAAVEKTIKKQVREALSAEGIFNPIADQRVSFPPLSFKLEELPALLVISPRDRIEAMREIVLRQKLTLKEKEAIEARADKLGVSSLVVQVGGMATYPSLIDSEASLRSVIDGVAHEWLHQYLAFTPLGFRYVLDVTSLSKNYVIATINESLVGMVGKEIGGMVYQKYYSKYENEPEPTPAAGFDFNLEMREIRKTVDGYLAQGEIERAEAFMEQKRQELASKGYYIRKLNQAYFAFHGTYADDPAYLSPIGLELKELRAKSVSLKAFLDKAAGMTSRQDLTESLR